MCTWFSFINKFYSNLKHDNLLRNKNLSSLNYSNRCLVKEKEIILTKKLKNGVDMKNTSPWKDLRFILFGGDGNCLSRFFAHQIDEGETKFANYWKLGVEYTRSNSAKFLESFRSEDGTWGEYLTKMEKNREWGGYLEILVP